MTSWAGAPKRQRPTRAVMADARAEEVAGTGHVSPLLIDQDHIGQLITDFWATATSSA